MPDFRVGELYAVHEPIDRPQGSFARVYLADDLHDGRQVAFKVLRAEHLILTGKSREDKYQAFVNEAQLLSVLEDDEHVMHLYGFGYLKSGPGKDFTPIPCSQDEFAGRVQEAIASNWRPYLSLQLMSSKDSLFRLINQNSHGWRLPTEEALKLSIQLAELYARIHEKHIIYWDAKPEHAYWQREDQRVVLIDWNVSRYLLEKESDSKRKQDVLQLGQGILFPAFIGLDFQTGKTPEAKPTSTFNGVRQRYVLDKPVDFYSQEEWLDGPVKQVLQRIVARNGYQSADDLLIDLQECALDLGWELPGKSRDGGDPQFLSHQDMVHGLGLLNEAQDNLLNARNLFEQAALRFPMHDREIQRLISESTDFWKRRVIP